MISELGNGKRMAADLLQDHYSDDIEITTALKEVAMIQADELARTLSNQSMRHWIPYDRWRLVATLSALRRQSNEFSYRVMLADVRERMGSGEKQAA